MDKPISVSENTKQSDSSKTARSAIATALITAFTTIGVSYIGVVPQLRKVDQQEIDVLKQKINKLEDPVKPVVKPIVGEFFSIKGTIIGANRNPMNDALVYLVPADSNIVTADSNGSFLFTKRASEHYKLIVASPSLGNYFSLLISPEDSLAEADGIAIKYKFGKE